MIVGREEGGGFEEFIDDMHRCFSVGTGTSTIDEGWSSKILFKRNLNVKYKSSHCTYLVKIYFWTTTCGSFFHCKPILLGWDLEDGCGYGYTLNWNRLTKDVENVCIDWNFQFRPGCRCLKELLVSRGIGWPFSPTHQSISLGRL